jgi:hypothetical protein
MAGRADSPDGYREENRMVSKITPADAGCWLDGWQGWHNTYRVCDRALDYGWLAGKPAERADIEALEAEYQAMHADGFFVLDVAEAMDTASSDATEYLNGIAPDGYTFVWDAGELSLMADSEAEELGHFG